MNTELADGGAPPSDTDGAQHGDSEVSAEPSAGEPGSASGSQDHEVADEEFELGAPDLGAALEALLIIAEDAMPVAEMAEITHADEAEVVARLLDLSAGYREEGRGFELREVAGGWRFYTAQACADLVGRYVTDGRQTKLSQAALETLTIIAYRQPVSRAHIGSVRGVNSDGVIRTLHSRGLITETAEDSSTGAVLYGTTQYFLDRMGIGSIADLPPVAEHIPDPASVEDL